MDVSPQTAIAALLRETENAHGTYETTELGGVRDDAWPIWYATFLLDHGLMDHIPGRDSVTVAALAETLSRLATDYEREQPETAWPDDYARGIVAEFGMRRD